MKTRLLFVENYGSWAGKILSDRSTEYFRTYEISSIFALCFSKKKEKTPIFKISMVIFWTYFPKNPSFFKKFYFQTCMNIHSQMKIIFSGRIFFSPLWLNVEVLIVHWQDTVGINTFVSKNRSTNVFLLVKKTEIYYLGYFR